jgi:hypothetical protein
MSWETDNNLPGRRFQGQDVGKGVLISDTNSVGLNRLTGISS